MPEQSVDRDSKIKEAYDFYNDRVMGWMIKDLQTSMDAGTNYLTALGCVVYTEVVGALLPKLDVKVVGRLEQKRFYRCFFRFPSSNVLKQLDSEVRRETNDGLYKHIRNRMTHKYYPSISLRTVQGEYMYIPTAVASHGILTPPVPGFAVPPFFLTREGTFVFAIRNYIEELEICVREAMHRTFIDHNPEYEEAALRGMNFLFRDAHIS